ncbi:MAG: SMI1/KNR4 family protein [Akkermansiaceae bacterium]|nr:SMI1/KNR4 family protein [Roseibacillus sp.]
MPYPITREEISKTEAMTGYIFPQGVKERMVRDNGGEISVAGDGWQLVPFLDTTDEERVAHTSNDIVRETSSKRSSGGFPHAGFVIAHNNGGDCLLVVPDPEGSKTLGDTIYFWDHETRRYEPVADSLDSI